MLHSRPRKAAEVRQMLHGLRLMAEIVVDKRKARDLAEKLVTAYREKEFYFRLNRKVPETILPKGIETGTLEHSLYLLYAVSLDSMRQSEYVYGAARRLVTEYNVRQFEFMHAQEFYHIMDRVMDNGMNRPAETLADAVKILRDYGGDPRVMFQDVHGFDQAVSRLIPMRGVSYDKAALIIKNFQKFGYLELDNPYDASIKIDRHIIRMSLGNSAVAPLLEGDVVRIDKFRKPLRKLYRDVCREYEIDPVDLCDAKWLIGSKVCARKSKDICEEYCPLDCDFLVSTDRKNTLITYPSEMRGDTKGARIEIQPSLFEEW